jgi:hypothetical protein
MGIVEFLLVCALAGVVTWLIVTLVPMPSPVRTVIIAATVVFLVLVFVRAAGLDVAIPRLR